MQKREVTEIIKDTIEEYRDQILDTEGRFEKILTQANEYTDKKFLYLTSIATLIAVIIGLVLGILGSDLIHRSIEKSLVEPEVKNSINSVLEKKGKDFVIEQVIPLEQKVASASKDVNALIEKTKLLSLYFDAKSGSQSALTEIRRLSSSQDVVESRTAEALFNDIIDSLTDVEYRFHGQTFFTKGWTVSRLSAENIYGNLHANAPRDAKEAAINAIELDAKYFVGPLVELITTENQDLRLAARGLGKLEILTNEHFGFNPPFDRVKEWWKKKGENNTSYQNPFPDLEKGYRLLQDGQIENGLALLEGSVKDRAHFCLTEYRIATIYRDKGDIESAKKHLAKCDVCDSPLESCILSAEISIESGDFQSAVNALQRLKRIDPDEFELAVQSPSLDKLKEDNLFKTAFPENQK